MKRYAREKSEPMLKPVQQIELSDNNIKIRIVIVIIAILVTVAAVGFGVHSCLAKEAGWRTIDAMNNADNLSGEFQLNYNLGQGKVSATVEFKTVTSVYTAATAEAYKLFDPYAGQGYLKEINTHPGIKITVDHELYTALESVLNNCGRFLYREPYNEIYELLSGADSDEAAALYDPRKNADIMSLFEKISVFVNDENSVRLELLGSDTVILHVSDEYKDFAKENEVFSYIGFSWLKNAFAADHIASRLTDAGYTYGYLSSCDGYTVYLNGNDFVYDVNLYNSTGHGLGLACSLEAPGFLYSVELAFFPLSPKGGGYVYDDGTFVTAYADETGMQKYASEVLFMYSADKSCAGIAQRAIEIYVADSIDEAKLKQALDDGIGSVYINAGKIGYTDKDAGILNADSSYSVSLIK